MTDYQLPVRSEAARRSAVAWLTLALLSLLAAGIFSVLLVLARTPFLQDRIPFVDFFRTALVVHVTLSVLVWLLAMSAVMWALGTRRDAQLWDRSAFLLAAVGTATITVSPFIGAGQPSLNNYVPMLQHPVFYAGLMLFAAGILLQVVRAAASWPSMRHHLDGNRALKAGLAIAALVTGLAMLAVYLSWRGLPTSMDGPVYFEFLFWGGGHIVQFSYTILMLNSWVVLANASQCRFELTPRLTLVFLVFTALPVITVPFLYLAHDVPTPGHRLAFTELMKYGGLSCLPLGLAIASSLWQAERAHGEGRHLRATLVSSVGLFLVGGILGFLIAGLDIVIPAHYHGATVGVTIAFMGLTYYLLPRLGFGAVPVRLATWQPLLYGGGQLLHIIGLAWSGGYGVQRKTAGAAQGLDGLGQTLGMGLMGIGGLISVVGGVLFLVVAWHSVRRRQTPSLP